jgi:GNAT superfamily N-acetyltransferase
MGDALDQAVASWFTMMRVLATALPTGVLMRQGAAVAMITGLRVPALNVVMTETVEPDVTAMSELAAKVRTVDLPWSIQVRGGVGTDMRELAMANGLSGRRTVPLMVCEAGEAHLRGREIPGAAVVRVGAADRPKHGRALDLGFETGGDVLAPLTEDAVLDAPGWVAYAAEIDGEQVATALGVRCEAAVGLFNVSVLPHMRGRGLGRIIIERVLADAFGAGATLAFLHSFPMAEPLYHSMGFRVAETWTVFS